MSSTTDRSPRLGQTLPIFAIFLVVLLAFVALAFDVGQMLLDKRQQQNAADAAALAGARFLVDPANPTTSAPCASKTTPSYCADAVDAALATAFSNHYGDGSSDGVAANGSVVKVSIPPGPESAFHGQPGYIEVQVGTNRPSVIGSVLGFFTHEVGALGTAANRNGATLNASLLALNPTECQSAMFVGGGTGGGVSVAGNIQVNSDCTGTNAAHSAFSAGGTTTVTVTAPGGTIDVFGSWFVGNNATVDPPPHQGPVLPDPFENLPAPTNKALPPDAEPIGVSGPPPLPPTGCPGSATPATEQDPETCTINAAGEVWLLSPGYYPGGIEVLKGTVYLLPGIYFIGGGGLTVGGNQAALYSVPAAYSSTTPPFTPTSGHAACDVNPPPSPSPCGGVMIYNSENDANGEPFAPISLGGNGAFVGLYPIQANPYTGIVIFQDRTQALNNSGVGDITLQGNNSNLWVNGAIYAKSGFIDVTGGGTIGSVQIIADTFRVAGNGLLSIPFNSGLLPQTHAVGLVE